jgi:NAD(P)-dependent dehydrogenase (short-subunit alcohol dehydrogenase family)
MTDIALITGANKGLGLTAARRLAEQGMTVWMGSRDADRGAAAAASLSGLDVRPIVLDVTDDASVDKAAATIGAEHGRLDVLVNNAGITGAQAGFADATADHVRRVYETNVFGAVRVTRAFLPWLRAADAARIVMVSSGLGSHGWTEETTFVDVGSLGLAYPSSKAALNMIASQYARSLPEMRVNVADPGYTATDLNGHQGFQTVEEGTDAIVALATLAPDGPTGGFVSREGPVPW